MNGLLALLKPLAAYHTQFKYCVHTSAQPQSLSELNNFNTVYVVSQLVLHFNTKWQLES